MLTAALSALLVSAVALVTFFSSGEESVFAMRIHEWGVGAALLLLTLSGLMIAEGVETRMEVRALRVRSERHVHVVATLAVVVLCLGFGLQLIYSGALQGSLLEVAPESIYTFIVLFTGCAVVAGLSVNGIITASLGMYGFKPGPLFRSARRYYGQGMPGGCTLNAGMFTALSLGALSVPLPFLAPGLLLLAYACILGRAGWIAAWSA